MAHTAPTATIADMNTESLEQVANAAADIVAAMQSFAAAGSNIVFEVLQGAPFVELEHYPPGDICDPENGSQYYFHAHPPARPSYSDFGHFHLFLRPEKTGGVGGLSRSRDDKTICHLAGISVDRRGFPVGLFTTNRWVTDEAFYTAEDTIAMLDRFQIEGPVPAPEVNLWVSAVPVVYRADIEALIRERDVAIEAWRREHPERDVFEDRRLEILSWKKINLEDRLAEIREALDLE